jgi:prepilin-type N-terminal cleavage/methylation domain-containing protein
MSRVRGNDSESGFTLIELLVVMLILGILASIALPLFISQRGRAYDAEAKSTANSAELAMEACGNDHNGYDESACDVEALHTIEPTLPDGPPLVVSPEGDGYRIDVEALNTENVFSIVRLPGGGITYPCTVAGSDHGGCEVTEGTIGVWRR